MQSTKQKTNTFFLCIILLLVLVLKLVLVLVLIGTRIMCCALDGGVQ